MENHNAYIICPGSFTGDLWHLAAAEILSSQYAHEDNFHYNIVTVIAVSDMSPDNQEVWKTKEQNNVKAAQDAVDKSKKTVLDLTQDQATAQSAKDEALKEIKAAAGDKAKSEVAGQKMRSADTAFRTAKNALPGAVEDVAIAESNLEKVKASVGSNYDLGEAKKEHERGQVTFDYLKRLGLPCLLVVVRGYSAGQDQLNKCVFAQSNEWFDGVWSEQKNSYPDFKTALATVLKTDHTSNSILAFVSGQKPPAVATSDYDNLVRNRVLPLMVATTIAMQFLRNPATRIERRKILSFCMSHDGSKTISKEDAAAGGRKYDELRKLVAIAKEQFHKETGADPEGIILENYRKGHTNAGTDSNEFFSAQLKVQAKRQKLAVITVAAVNTRLQALNLIDLRSKDKSDLILASLPPGTGESVLHSIQGFLKTFFAAPPPNAKLRTRTGDDLGDFDIICRMNKERLGQTLEQLYVQAAALEKWLFTESGQPDRIHNKAQQSCVFDFFNKLGLEGPHVYPGLAPCAQAYFWSLVADDKDIVGIFGGRSGSIDLTAFCGVRAFYWDEPWINITASAPGADDAIGKNWKGSEQFAKSQIDQCLRSLELHYVMAIGYPKLEARDDKIEPWKTIDEEPLGLWLDSAVNRKPAPEVQIFPPFAGPNGWRDKKNSLMSYRVPYLERASLGIKAYALDDMGYV